MKMSEVLDTAITQLEQAIADKVPAIIEVASGDCANLLKAAEAYDTHLADIDRLLDRLEPFAEIYKTDVKMWQKRRGDEYTAMTGYDLEKNKAVKITAKQFDLAHQTYTELRETYGEKIK